jgi:hypothetical protein
MAIFYRELLRFHIVYFSEGDEMKKLLLVALAVVLAACSAGGSEFSRNQEKWQDANITHYRMQLNISCFCAFRDQMPLTVEVRDGQIVSMAAVDGALVLDTDPNYEFFAPHATIDLLFAELDSALNGGADSVTVTYDATYGFPTEIAIDFSQQTADEEMYYTISGFEALP